MLRVLHIVRRFGPVGGMERYVWRLTHELSQLGVYVQVLCQTVEGTVDPAIQVHRVDSSVERRRWKAMRDFRGSCEEFWAGFPDNSKVIVHSHERCAFHNVTTFHGPPIGGVGSQFPWWKRLQPRIKAWSRFEQAELLGSQVVAVIPVSSMIRNALKRIYPNVAHRMKNPGWPGLDYTDRKQNLGTGTKLLFVGREWKRKGLDIAINAYLKVKANHPGVTLDVYGVLESEVPRSLRVADRGVTFRGWQAVVPYELYDLLIHPARDEPFGMVVPEARAAGLSILISDRVGALDLPLSNVIKLSLHDDSLAWSRAIVDALRSEKPDSEVCWTWSDLAKWHVTDVYTDMGESSIPLSRGL